MYCNKCGKQIDNNADFCPFCGNKIEKNETFTEQLSKNNPFKPVLKMLKKGFDYLRAFVLKHKKMVFIVVSVCFVLFISYSVFQKVYDFTKLSWDDKSASLKFTENHKVTLNVVAIDKEKNPISNITFETDNGELESDGTLVTWYLPNNAGTYEISAIAPSGKKITKKITLIDLKEENVLHGYLEEEPKDSDDSDEDGLTNIEEASLGTDPLRKDTDMDGLSDY